MRPDEQAIAARQKVLVGKTIVDVSLDGAGDATLPSAKTAILSRPGDVFAEDPLEKDRTAIYDTGLFYDIFPTFETVPEGVIITYHLLENPALRSVTLTGNTVYKNGCFARTGSGKHEQRTVHRINSLSLHFIKI